MFNPIPAYFPWRQLGVLAICRLVEPIAFCSITAYVFSMVQDIKGPENASFFAGLLVAAFAAAEACTAWIWGDVSDRYGRKPVILFALAGTAISSFMFGLSSNYWMALIARVLGGCLNGNTAVMQTMVAEIVTDPKHEPVAYALQPFMWNVGAIAGSVLGGFAAKPARLCPEIFADTIFESFPYLLPNLISAFAILLAFVIGWGFLQETNWNCYNSLQDDSIERPSEFIQSSGRLLMHEVTYSELKQHSTDSTETCIEVLVDKAVGVSTTLTPQVLAWMFAAWILSYHQMAFASLLPVFLLDDTVPLTKRLTEIGGLGQTLSQVGTVLTASSIMSLLAQGVMYPALVSWQGVWNSLLISLLLAPLPYLTMPLTAYLPNPQSGIYVLLALQSLTTTVSYPLVLILLKQACPSPSVLGRINGIAMSGCSAARTIAPPLAGLLWARSGSIFAWWSVGCVALVGLLQFMLVKRPSSKFSVYA